MYYKIFETTGFGATSTMEGAGDEIRLYIFPSYINLPLKCDLKNALKKLFENMKNRAYQAQVFYGWEHTGIFSPLIKASDMTHVVDLITETVFKNLKYFNQSTIFCHITFSDESLEYLISEKSLMPARFFYNKMMLDRQFYSISTTWEGALADVFFRFRTDNIHRPRLESLDPKELVLTKNVMVRPLPKETIEDVEMPEWSGGSN